MKKVNFVVKYILSIKHRRTVAQQMQNKKFKTSIKTNKKSEIQKDFYKRLLYIGICIFPILMFAENEDEFRLVPLPFFLFGMYQIILLVGKSQIIIDDFFPPKTYYEKKTNSFDKFLYYFATALTIVGLLSLLFEIKNFDNTIQGSKLFWIAGLGGMVMALIITLLLKTFHPSVYDESKRRYTVHLGLFIGFFLVSAALSGFCNHHFATPSTFSKNYVIERKSIGGHRSKEYFFILTIDNNEERFSVGQTRYDNFSEGEQIELSMLKGKLGFDYVTEFKKVAK